MPVLSHGERGETAQSSAFLRSDEGTLDRTLAAVPREAFWSAG
jgi:hypothetical protein